MHRPAIGSEHEWQDAVGGYFDDEFSAGTLSLFDHLLAGHAVALISDTLVAELADAPERVQELPERVLAGGSERLRFVPDVEDLQQARQAC